MSGQRPGYLRASNLNRNTQGQVENIQVDRMFTDKAYGNATKRPQLE